MIDTTRLNVHQLRDIVIRYVAEDARSTVVNLASFGFRYGTPPSAELLFDLLAERRARWARVPDVVFCSATGGHFRNLSRHWTRLRRKAQKEGFRIVHMHDPKISPLYCTAIRA